MAYKMKGYSYPGKSPAKQKPGAKYDLSKATVDGKHPQTEQNKKYEGMDKGELFLQGKTKDKDGNIKDIQWAPNPNKKESNELFTKEYEKTKKDWLHNVADPNILKNMPYNKKKSPAKQKGHSKIVKGTYETSEEDHAKQNPYWYKINGKRVSKYVYNKYENKPGKMEGGGKTTNDPDASGRKAQRAIDREKLRKPTVLTKKQTENLKNKK